MQDMFGVPSPLKTHKAGRACCSFLQLSPRPYHRQYTIFGFSIALLIYLQLVTTKAIVLPFALISNSCHDLACLITLPRLNLNVGSPVLPYYYCSSLVFRVLNTWPHDANS